MCANVFLNLGTALARRHNSAAVVKVCVVLSEQATRAYSLRNKNILRGRYQWRNKEDGLFKEYNESIAIVPPEFAQQDEYKFEKRLDTVYKERYKSQLKKKEKKWGVQISPDKEREIDAELELAYSKYSATQKRKLSDIKREYGDQPVKLSECGGDPFKKAIHQCIFCTKNVPLDYKNVQMLSQFVSPHTGIIYSQQVTGLCHYKYAELEQTINKARRLALMPLFYKETTFTSDPKIFDPFKNILKKIENNHDKRKLYEDE